MTKGYINILWYRNMRNQLTRFNTSKLITRRTEGNSWEPFQIWSTGSDQEIEHIT